MRTASSRDSWLMRCKRFFTILIPFPRSCRRHEYRCRAAAISLAKGQYRFCRRQKYRSPITSLPNNKAGIGKPPPNARKSSSVLIYTPPFMPTGMNIVAALRQYRWPKANIVFAAGKNIVPNTPHTQTTKRALGKPPPNARKSSSVLIYSPPFMPTGMNIVAAQRQYRWPQANIVFADRQKYRSPNSPLKKQYGHWETNHHPMPSKVHQNLYPATPFMPQA